MPVNDPIADLLTRLRNAQHARRADCTAPWSKIKQAICQLLQDRGYVSGIEVEGEGAQKMMRITFSPLHPTLRLRRISTPGGRRYVSSQEMRAYMHGASFAILSTSLGLITDREAKEKNIGGELLCTVA